MVAPLGRTCPISTSGTGNPDFGNNIVLVSNSTLNLVGQMNYYGAISGSYGLTLTGGGAIWQEGNNSYTGSTTISDGLLVDAANTGLPSAAALTIDSSGTLQMETGVVQDLGSLVGHAVEPQRRRGRTDDFDRSLAQRVRRSHERAGPVLDERVPGAISGKLDAQLWVEQRALLLNWICVPLRIAVMVVPAEMPVPLTACPTLRKLVLGRVRVFERLVEPTVAA